MGDVIWGNMPPTSHLPQKWPRIRNFKPKRRNIKSAIPAKL